MWERASELWAAGEQIGQANNDADLLIAATAIENGLALVTGNRRHFARISGLTIEDWRTP